MSSDMKDVGFYNPHSGIKGRDGGPYLDQAERAQAEVNRARQEGREPDLDRAPANAGTPLVTANRVVDNSFTSNPSRRNAPSLFEAVRDEDLNTDDYVSPYQTLPVDVGTSETEDEPETEDEDEPKQESIY